MQRLRARSRRHLVSGIDIGLEHHGNAMQRPAHDSCAPLPVPLLGDRTRLGVQIEKGPQSLPFTVRSRPWAVENRNASQIIVDKLSRAEPPRPEFPLEIPERVFFAGVGDAWLQTLPAPS